MKKRLFLAVGVLMVTFLGFAGVALAGEASVFDAAQDIIIRAYTSPVYQAPDNYYPNGPYSVYLEVRNSGGVLLSASGESGVTVTDISNPSDPNVLNSSDTEEPKTATYLIHNNDAVKRDLSLSFDSVTGKTYLFCTDVEHGVHVMTYEIRLNKPIEGTCGSAGGSAFYTLSESDSGLCSAGTVKEFDGGGPWTWTCEGANGGGDAGCRAELKVNGVCGASSGVPSYTKPATNLCGDGASPSVTGTGPWYWTCPGTHGGQDSPQCSAERKVDGACGSANGQTFTTLSETSDGLCSSGTVGSFQGGTSGWTWHCDGLNGGTNATNCSAQLQQGQPDLTISIGRTPTSFNAGTPINVSVTVRNGGSSNAGPFIVGVSGASGTWSVGGLSAGDSASTTMIIIPGSSCPIHYWCRFTFKADDDNQVAESSESNNTASFQAYRGR